MVKKNGMYLCCPRLVMDMLSTSVDPSIEYHLILDCGTDSTLHVMVAFSPVKQKEKFDLFAISIEGILKSCFTLNSHLKLLCYRFIFFSDICVNTYENEWANAMFI